MRLWSLHPSMLDRQGLVACWREALLAQAVLLGRTRGYTAHPQLDRFKAQPQPEVAIGAYLGGLHDEAVARGYRFDADRILHRPQTDGAPTSPVRIPVTTGQLEFERGHLATKLARRSPDFLASNQPQCQTADEDIAVHPVFYAVPGPVEPWERTLLPTRSVRPRTL